MSYTAITLNFLKSRHRLLNRPPQLTFDHIILIKKICNPCQIVLRKRPSTGLVVQAKCKTYFKGPVLTDTVQVLQRYIHCFVVGKIDAK